MSRLKRCITLLLAAVMMLTAAAFSVSAEGHPNPANRIAPTVYNIRFEGRPVVGEEMKITYDISDPGKVMTDGDGNIDTSNIAYSWYRADSPSDVSSNVKKVSSTDTYTLTTEDIGKYLKVSVEVLNNDSGTQKAPYFGLPIGPVLESVPTDNAVSNVYIYPKTTEPEEGKSADSFAGSGAAVGSTLEGTFFAMKDGAPESEFTYQWYTAESEEADAQKTPISGANSKEYTVQAEDAGKYLVFGVTPSGGSETLAVNRPKAGTVSYMAPVAPQPWAEGKGSNAGYNYRAAFQLATMGMRSEDYGNIAPYSGANTDTLLPNMVMLELDMGESKNFNKIEVFTTNNQEFEAELQYSTDRQNWTGIQPTSTGGRAEITDGSVMLTQEDIVSKVLTVNFEEVQGRYVRLLQGRQADNYAMYITEIEVTGRNISEEEPEEPATLTGISAALNQGVSELTIPKGASAEDVKAYLSANVTVTATYDDQSTVSVPFDDITVALSTDTAGPAQATLSYQDKTATVDVTIVEGSHPQVANRIAPTVYNIRIQGRPIVGQELKVTYDISDPGKVMTNGDGTIDTGQVIINWYQMDTVKDTGGTVKSVSSTDTYTVTEEVVGKYLKVRIEVPDNDEGTKKASFYSLPLEPVLAQAPEENAVSNVYIYPKTTRPEEGKTVESFAGGGAAVGSVLEGTFIAMKDGAQESDFTYQWYTAESEAADAAKTAIPGATGKEYMIRQEDAGKYLVFGVTPNGESETLAVNRPKAGTVSYMAPTAPQVWQAGKSSTDGFNWRTTFQIATMGMRSDGYGNIAPYGGKVDPNRIMLELDMGELKKFRQIDVFATNSVAFNAELQYSTDRKTWNNILATSTGAREEINPPSEKLTEADLIDATEIGSRIRVLRVNFEEIQGRYVRVLLGSTTDSYPMYISEIEVTGEDIPKTLAGITAVKKDAEQTLELPLNATNGEIKAYLQDKIDITAQYTGGIDKPVDASEAEYSADTTASGQKQVTISWGGVSTTIEVTIKEPAALTKIEVVKNAGVEQLAIAKDADADAIKAYLADKITVTGTYDDGSTKTIPNADITYSGDTSTVGAGTVTLTYEGQSTTLDITIVESVELVSITATVDGTIEIDQYATTEEAKDVLKNNVTVTAEYSDGNSTEVAFDDVTVSVSTNMVGDTTATLSYGGKTTTVPVRIVSSVPAGDVDPAIYDMKIVGSPVLGETLTFEYTLDDPAGVETDVTSKIEWQRQHAPYYVRSSELPTGKEVILQKGGVAYTIPNDSNLVGQYIAVNIKVGDGYHGQARYRTVGVGPILASAPGTPVVSSVMIQSPQIGSDSGQTLYGHYNYAGSAEEGDSIYQWYIGSSASGEFEAIEGANSLEYTPTNADKGKYLKFSVTPVDVNGNRGLEAESTQRPTVGDAAYGAFVTGGSGGYAGCSLSGVANGIYTDEGGGLFTYGNQAEYGVLIDLGKVKQISGASVLGGGASEVFQLQASTNGTDYTPIFTADYTGGDTVQYITYGQSANFDFKESVFARYIKLSGPTSKNLTLRDIVLFVADNEEPVITLEGEAEMNVFLDSEFVEPGYTATDAEDGVLTERVVVTGTVDTSQVGTYVLTYSVTDSKPQTVQVTRTVHVAEGFQTEGDLAFQKPVTAGGTAGEQLVDGNPYTEWNTGSASASAVIDLGAQQLFSKMTLMEEGNNVTSYKLEVSTDGTAWSTVVEGGAINGTTTTDFTPQEGRYVRLTVESAQSANITTLEVFLDDKGKVELAKEALTIPGTLTQVTGDLALANKGLYDTAITWTSSNPAVITNDGIVTRGSTDQTVTMTATITLGEVTAQKEFTNIRVLKKTSTSGGGGGTGGGGGNSGGRDQSSSIYVPDNSGANQVTPIDPEDLNPFSDVPSTHWAFTYINELADSGIVNGTTDRIFEPDGTVTRAEYVKMLVEALGISTEGAEAGFTDVGTEDWCYAYVAAASANGIVQGLGDGRFGADDPISRQDMAVMTMRAAEVAGIDLGGADSELDFTDTASIAEYAVDAVAAMKNAGILNGDETGAFLPENNATRAEAAKIISVTLEVIHQA